MAVQWGLAQPQGGGFDYLESLQALGQQQLQQQAIQQRQYGFDRQQQQDAARTTVAARARTGDYAGARQDAALGGDFDFANALGSLDDDKIKRLGVELDAIGTLVPQLRALPADQRAAVGSAALARVGFSPQELQAMDWTDAGLDAAYTMSASGKAALAARMKAAEPRVVADGGALVDGTGNVLYENQREEKPIWDAEGGNLIYPSRYAGGGSSTSAASGGGSRAARNNNPGNIIDSAFARSQPGYQGSDGRFARFATTEAGAGAQAALLGSYIDRGYNTVEKIINRWAPPSENDTGSYVRNVARALNVDPRQPLDKSAIPALQRIITRVEGGPGGSSAGGNRPASQPGVVHVRAPRARGGDAPSGYRYNGDRLEPIPGGPADPSGPTNRNVQSNRKAEADFRKEFEQDKGYTEFQAARTSFNQLRDLVRKKGGHSGADDLAIIFNFMRSLDPASVVREGEFKQAANSSGLIEGLGNTFQRAQNGQWLNPKQRQEMLRTAYSNYQSRRDAYNNRAEQFRGYARDNGINPDRVARTYTPDKPASSASPSRLTVGQSANIGGIKITRTR